MKTCLLIPNYDHGEPLRRMLGELERWNTKCFVIDDGSGDETLRILEEIETERPWVEVHRCKQNRGRGAALKIGYRLALERGFSHAIQLDADGQHCCDDVPRFLHEIEEHPDAIVLGAPIFDDSAPRLRLYGRQLSRGLVWLSSLSFSVHDPLCGFRGIPLARTLEVLDTVETGDRMDFDPELLILLQWKDVPVRNVPTRVVYDHEGLSHFDMVGDNLRMAALYTRSVGGMLLQLPRLAARRGGLSR